MAAFLRFSRQSIYAAVLKLGRSRTSSTYSGKPCSALPKHGNCSSVSSLLNPHAPVSIGLSVALIIVGAAVGSVIAPVNTQPELHRVRGSPEQQADDSSAQLVRLPVTVTDKKGNAVTNLTAKDFRVLEDKVVQPIVYFEPPPLQPLAIGLLMDWSGSRRSQLPGAELAPALSFLKRFVGGNNRALIYSFSDEVWKDADLTADLFVVEEALRRLSKTVPGGSSALYDGLNRAMVDLARAGGGKPILIVISDGTDNDSRTTLERVLTMAAETEVSIYFVFVRPEARREARRADPVVDRLTRDTGGMAILAESNEGMHRAFAAITEALEATYVIGFRPMQPLPHRKLRQVRVEVTSQDLRVRTRKGYLGPQAKKP